MAALALIGGGGCSAEPAPTGTLTQALEEPSDCGCPPIWRKGVLTLPFSPAFTAVDSFNAPGSRRVDGLLVSSFFNAIRDPSGANVIGFFTRDQVARIPDLTSLNPALFNPATDLEGLTDLAGPPYRTVWPNGVRRVPDGVLPFEAVVVPGGFHITPQPGRLSLINLGDPLRTEYIIQQSTFVPPSCAPLGASSSPRFYHTVRFVDMDGDGRKDIVTVRSSFKVAGGFCPPIGELVYFKNPGPALSPTTPWAEVVLFGLPTQFSGPDVHLDVHDFEGDGVPEVVATHFFNRGGAIRLYGAPAGRSWAAVNNVTGPFVRERDLSTDQGAPFDVQIVDLNGDGKADVLATNHQSDNCFPVTQSPIPGRVYALEQPASANIFGDPWTPHILKDNIRPNPTFPVPTRGPGRQAPGAARAFWTRAALIGHARPSIVVGGDQASKVWVLTPRHPGRRDSWDYDGSVIFDINDAYGAGTTQTVQGDATHAIISTVGEVSVRYDSSGPDGRPEFYIPVFEARQIHVLSLRPQGPGSKPEGKIRCSADDALSCPAP